MICDLVSKMDGYRVEIVGTYILITGFWGKEASNPKMEYQIFLCIFQKKSAMANLSLKEMGKFLWEGREEVLPSWLSQFSFAWLAR